MSKLVNLMTPLCVTASLVLVNIAPAADPVQLDTFVLKKTKYKARVPKVPLSSNVPVKDLFGNKFLAKGQFTLGPTSDGIDFTAETVHISLDDFTQSIEPGDAKVTIKKDGSMKFKFRSKDINVFRVVTIAPKRNGEFKWKIKGVKLPVRRPTVLTLQMGDDAGQIDLDTGNAQTLTATVTGKVIGGMPPRGLTGVTIEVPCPAGMCRTQTIAGRFMLEASPGPQTLILDGTTASGGTFPRLRQHADVRVGTTDAGLLALPELDTSNGVLVADGVQGAPVVVSSNPVTTGGTVELTIPTGATVMFPPEAPSPQVISISQVPLEVLPMGFPPGVGSPLVITAQPGGTTISPCADLRFPNVDPSLSDGTNVDVYGFDHAVGTFVPIGTGVVANGGADIVAPGVLCEFAWDFPAPPPTGTSGEGITVFNPAVPGAQVFGQGQSTRSVPAPPDTFNFELPDLFAGVAGSPELLSVEVEYQIPGGLLRGSAQAVAVQNGITDFGEVQLEFQPCGEFVTKWGSQGSGDGQFLAPDGIARDSSGNIFVTDRPTGRVQKFDADGNFLLSWGSTGSGNGQFDSPRGIDVNANGDVYVVDRDNRRIQKFDNDGNFLLAWGSQGGGAGQFHDPEDVAVDSAGNVYVIDSLTTQPCPICFPETSEQFVHKFDSSGNFLLQFEAGPEGFIPTGIAVSAADDIYVKGLSGSLSRFDTDGNPLGVAFVLFGHGIDVGPDGGIFLARSSGRCVDRVTPEGALLSRWGRIGPEDGNCNGPIDVVTAPDGSIYVLEEDNRRVSKFRCPEVLG